MNTNFLTDSAGLGSPVDSLFSQVLGALVSDYSIVFTANLDTDEADTVYLNDHSKEVIREIDPQTNAKRPYSDRLKIMADYTIYPDDRQRFLEQTKAEFLKDAISRGQTMTVSFRAALHGDYRHTEVKIVPLPSLGNHCIVVAVRDAECDFLSKQHYEDVKREWANDRKSLSVISALSDDFDYVAHIDLHTLEIVNFRIDPFFKSVYDSVDSSLPPSQRISQLLQRVVYPEDYSIFILKTDMRSLLRELGQHNTYSIPCRLSYEGRPRHYDVIFAKNSKDASSVVVGFKNIEAQVTSEQQRTKEEIGRRSSDLMNLLSDQFLAIFDVDLTTDSFEITAKNSLSIHNILSRISGQDSFFEFCSQAITSFVYFEDRSRLKSRFERETILSELENRPYYEYTCRFAFDGSPIWYRIRVTYKDVDKKHLLIGVFDVNEELLQEEALRIYEQDTAAYRRAILHNAYSYFKINLTRNEIIPPIIEKVNGEPVDYSPKFGPLLPSYDIAIWTAAAAYVSKDYRDDYSEFLSSEYLIHQFELGNTMPEYTCLIYSTVIGWHYRKYINYLSRDEKSGDILSMLVAYDVSDLMKRQQAEREQRENIDRIMNLSDNFESIYDVDLISGSFKVSSKDSEPFEEPNGLPSAKEDFFTTAFSAVLHNVAPEDQEMMSLNLTKDYIMRRLSTEPSYSLDYRNISHGRIEWYRMKIVRIGDTDTFRRMLVGIFNNDANIRAQKEHQRQLQDALTLAQSANRAKTVFLNNMSHDIRTPMNAIIGFTNLATDHLTSACQVQDYLKKIKQSSEHLLSLINDVLDMSRIESGNMTLNNEEQNLSDIIHSLTDIVHSDILRKHLDFTVRTENIMHEFIICDKLRLNQVFLNVLSNAIKYTPDYGSIVMHIIEKEPASEECASFEFRIHDNGMGISKEFLKTIYDPFTRVKNSTVSGIQGTGLGMAITKKIVDLMNGNIDIQSEENIGTEVTLSFDFALKSKEGIPVCGWLKGRRALFFTKDTLLGNSISRILSEDGMRSEVCNSYDTLLSVASEAKESGDAFRVFLIDITRQEDWDFEAIRKLSELAGSSVPIMVVTSLDWSDNEEKARAVGITTFLAKPVFPSDLRGTLKSCFEPCPIVKPQKPEKPKFSNQKVLLVEDNPLNMEIAQTLLEEYGLTVECVEDGSYAVSRLMDAAPGEFRLVFMDIQMPLMDGHKATGMIRSFANREIARIPIVAMTANAFSEDRTLALESGMNDYIAKPIQPKRLEEVLLRFLHRD